MSIFTLPFRQPMAAADLPLTLMSLEDWALVTVKGQDSVNYLQGQLTLDVAALTTDQHFLCAHCDAKGKMWSNLRLFHHNEGLAYIERRSLCENQMGELKKYSVFAKVTFSTNDESVLLAVAGTQARSVLAEHFEQLPDATTPVVQQGGVTLLWFAYPKERFLLISSLQQAEIMQQALTGRAQFNNSAQWLALDIEAGLAIIEAKTSVQFIPQATNLHILKGISFKKGCYTGQEMIARAKYRGANKRALFWLAGRANHVPEAGDALELKLGEKWRRTGTVLTAVQLKCGGIWVQAILNNDLDAGSILRVQEDAKGYLVIQPLPYAITPS